MTSFTIIVQITSIKYTSYFLQNMLSNCKKFHESLFHSQFIYTFHTHSLEIYYAPHYLQAITRLQIVSAHFPSLIFITCYFHKTAHSIKRYMSAKLPSPTHPFYLYKFVLWYLSCFIACYREMAGETGI